MELLLIACAPEGAIAVITVLSGFDIQTRLVGHYALYRMLLSHSPRLCAFLNKRIFDCRLNCNNRVVPNSCYTNSYQRF